MMHIEKIQQKFILTNLQKMETMLTNPYTGKVLTSCGNCTNCNRLLTNLRKLIRKTIKLC
jgi:C4-type Zn-finger protein